MILWEWLNGIFFVKNLFNEFSLFFRLNNLLSLVKLKIDLKLLIGFCRIVKYLVVVLGKS